MKPDFFELVLEHNQHNTFLNLEGMVSGMKTCYQQGILDGQKEVLDWLSNQKHLTNNIDYIIEEWKNQNQL